MNIHRDNPRVQNVDLHVSVAGRKLGLLDDDELNRIDHAANSLIRRIRSKHDALIDMRCCGVLSKFVPFSCNED